MAEIAESQNEPNKAAILHTLGAAAHQAGRYEEAIELFSKAIETNPRIPQFHNSLGIAFKALGKPEEAINAYQQSVRLEPSFAEGYYNLANAQRDHSCIAEALDNYKQAIRVKPQFAKAYYNLANLLRNQKQLVDAVENYKQAIRLRPDYAIAYNNLGLALKSLGRDDEAIEYYKQAICIKGDYSEAYNNLGIALKDQGQLDEALENYTKAIRLKPDYPESYNNMGTVLHSQGRYDEAIEKYEQVIRLQPDHAGAHWNHSLLLLLTGRYSEGWKEYQWRRKIKSATFAYPHCYEKPCWDGSSFAGKRLLVHYEQGMGDNLQFVRYLPMVKARGGTVIFESPKAMYGLMRRFDAIDELVEAVPESKPDVEFDLYTSIMDLPYIFGTTLETIPSDVPYLYADSAKVKYWRDRLTGAGFKVGLVWGGRPIRANEVLTLQYRSCSLEHFEPLANIPTVQLYGLQKGPAAAQVKQLSKQFIIENFGEEFEDFTDTAGAIENLDLVISIDTSAAHLAGAMGKPTWVLLKFDADWRWLLERQDCPWYPTMRLFRQNKGEDWDIVIKRVAKELQTLISSKQTEHRYSKT